MEFDWDFANLEHIARHKVEPEEAEEALRDPAVLETPAHRGPLGQRRYGIIGATEAGRVLVIFYELRGERIRVVTVRAATPEERTRYYTEE
ncbi:BrnT family toxin [Deinococcus planocerae]|uniref:BrnT family toxin n=1 Tax=Deinococcus planocerae TaxID=1737569 RepID=UPI000C7F0154|nr:BrnT family toxin [Deinococcus planocerae]